MDLEELAVATTAQIESPVLAAAGEDDEKASEGGVAVAYNYVGFTGFETRATRDPHDISSTYRPNANVYYSDLYEDGSGLSVSWIAHSPATSTPAMGDSFYLVTFDYCTFAGRTGTPAGDIDTLTLMGFWSDVKTMINAPGSRSVVKPYIRFGVGLGTNSEVSVNGGEFYSQGLNGGLRAGLGIDVNIIGLQLFVDYGPQIISAPLQAGDNGVGEGESIFTAPLRLGLTLTF